MVCMYILPRYFNYTYTVQNAGFTSALRSWIALVSGKAEKAADLLAALNESLDSLLNEYATTKSFQVLFEESMDVDPDTETGEGSTA